MEILRGDPACGFMVHACVPKVALHPEHPPSPPAAAAFADVSTVVQSEH